ncbi:hypothetical protein PN290_12055 [Romboutsia sp. 1001216sp1]|uniref:hypothetical protein n=1 Tax=Romboutsia TaxID=1501226 RepID=UPI000B8A40D4|nr:MULTISPECIES: hypothetical protein [Romboutsia]MDB8793968.1 hypothetical protein [Romboutsia sp. 1001216sp1]MDB8796895.1 hypothetical protein [Romboutsia sp. 1001216sp1]MDB8800109.1 hypothetical protein [Romboutsia sp. 1001216sp1]
MMKKKMILELDERYFNKNDLMEATVKHFYDKGHTCKILDYETIIIDDYKYKFKEWNMCIGSAPVQQVILTLIK